MYSEITYDERDHIGTITIDRPEARNALTYTTYDELQRAVETSKARCLIITGAIAEDLEASVFPEFVGVIAFQWARRGGCISRRKLGEGTAVKCQSI